MLSRVFFQLRRQSVASRNAIDVAITKENDVVLRLAEPRCRLHERIEHRLQIECRATDDLEHVARSSLLLQGFPQFAQQSRVFDGDHSLISEVLQQLDLFIGKRTHFLTINSDDSNYLIIFEHRHTNQRARFSNLNRRNAHPLTVSWSIAYVIDLNHFLAENDPTHRTLRMRLQYGFIEEELTVLLGCAFNCDDANLVTLAEP